MRFAIYAPWALSLLIAAPPLARGLRCLPDRVDPRATLVLLTASMTALATATTTSLGLLAVAGAVELSGSSSLVSPDGHDDPGALPMGVLSAAVVGIVLVRVGRELVSRRRQRRRVRAAVSLRSGRVGDVLLVDDDDVFAVATPAHGGRAGRVIASRGMFAALTEHERAAVLAHEQEHLDRGHHRFLAVAALAVAVNPLLALWWRDLAYSAERCADEGAARRVADRTIVAHAVGRVALAAHSHARTRGRGGDSGTQALGLGVTTGAVPRRVAVLLSSPHTRQDHPTGRLALALALVAATVLVTVAVLATTGAVHAAWDLSELLRTTHAA